MCLIVHPLLLAQCHLHELGRLSKLVPGGGGQLLLGEAVQLVGEGHAVTSGVVLWVKIWLQRSLLKVLNCCMQGWIDESE